MIGVSKCLAGVNCTYAGKNNLQKDIKKLVDKKKAIMLCPEVLGGLPTPRTPCEIIGDRVIDQNGVDRTYEYEKGAKLALDICLENDIKIVVLKKRSPSCGRDFIYDGTFSHTYVKGDGVFTKILQQNGIKVYNEDEVNEVLKIIEKEK